MSLKLTKRVILIALLLQVSIILTEAVRLSRNEDRNGLRSRATERHGNDLRLNWAQDDPNNIRFYLFPNPRNTSEMQEIVLGSSNLDQLKFDKNAQTKFIVHGFVQNLEAEFPQNVKNAYLKRMREKGDKWNIVVVDWGKLAYELKSGLPLYTRAVRNVEPTGKRLGEIVQFLEQKGLISDLDHVHFIGQSLGAHVVGAAGWWLSNVYPNKVGRISGTDPAGPLFYAKTLVGRQLQTSDAHFVDVYHCNPGGFGILGSIGDIEFYPNPQRIGNIQPQCLKFRPGYLEEPEMCSHNYCPKFFALSIIKNITAQKCEGFDLLRGHFGCKNQYETYGEDVRLGATGKYYVDIPEKLDDMNIFLN